jgi:hypothetical protein
MTFPSGKMDYNEPISNVVDKARAVQSRLTAAAAVIEKREDYISRYLDIVDGIIRGATQEGIIALSHRRISETSGQLSCFSSTVDYFFVEDRAEFELNGPTIREHAIFYGRLSDLDSVTWSRRRSETNTWHSSELAVRCINWLLSSINPDELSVETSAADS